MCVGKCMGKDPEGYIYQTQSSGFLRGGGLEHRDGVTIPVISYLLIKNVIMYYLQNGK